MPKKHFSWNGTKAQEHNFILVGFGDLGKKLYPCLHLIRRLGFDFNIYTVDIRPLYDDDIKMLNNRFKKFCGRELNEKELNELHNNHCTSVEELRGKIENLPAIIYVATPPDEYYTILDEYYDINEQCLFAIEKPLALTNDDAEKIKDFVISKRNEDKVFVYVDHYFTKVTAALKELRNKREIHEAKEVIIQFCEKESIPPERKNLYKKMGLLFDMGPHVLAVLRPLITKIKEIEVDRVYTATYIENDGKPAIPYETYVKMYLRSNQMKIKAESGKAMPKDITTITLNGEKLNLIEQMAAYFSIINDLFQGNFDQFMSIEDAVEVIQVLEKARNKIYAKPNIPYKNDTHPSFGEEEEEWGKNWLKN